MILSNISTHQKSGKEPARSTLFPAPLKSRSGSAMRSTKGRVELCARVNMASVDDAESSAALPSVSCERSAATSGTS